MVTGQRNAVVGENDEGGAHRSAQWFFSMVASVVTQQKVRTVQVYSRQAAVFQRLDMGFPRYGVHSARIEERIENDHKPVFFLR